VVYTESGSYQAGPFENAAGCDSIANLNLTILEETSSTTDISACEEYEWNGVVYTESGSYQAGPFENAAGCDSIANLNLTINQSSESFAQVVTCGTFEWNGDVYSQSGIYTFQTSNEAGCDSTATLDLTINGPDCNNEGDCENFQAFYVNHGSGINGSDLYNVSFSGGQAILDFELNVDFEAHIAYNEDDDIVYLVNADGSFIRAYDPTLDQELGDLPLAAGLSSLYAVVYNPSDELIYVGSANADEIYTIDPNGDGSFNPFATGPIQGGDLAFQDGELYLATRQNDKLWQIVGGGSPVEVGNIPAEVNGMAKANNATDLLVTNFGSNVITQVNSADASVTANFVVILDGEPFTLNNGDFTTGCADGGDIEVCENYKYYYLSNTSPDAPNGTVFEASISGNEVTLSQKFSAGFNAHLAVNSETGDFYVIKSDGSEIRTYDQDGGLLITSAIEGLNSTYAMAFDPADSQVYVGSANANKVYKLDPLTGAYSVFANNVPVNGGDIIVSGDQVLLIERGNGVSQLHNITSGDDVFVANLIDNINGATGTADGRLIVAQGNSNNFWIYNTDGSGEQELVALDPEGFPFELVNGDMAGGCFEPDDVEECVYTLFYSNDEDMGGGSDIYAMTLNGDFTTTNTFLTNVPFGSHGLAYDDESGLLYIIDTEPGELTVWDVTTNSLAAGPFNIQTAGGMNIIKTPTGAYKDGVLYVGSSNPKMIYEVDPLTGIAVPFMPADIWGADLVFDGNDDLWLIRRPNGAFINLTSGGSFNVDLQDINGVALLPNGNFIASNGDFGSLFYEVDVVAGALSGVTYNTGLVQYWGDLTAGCLSDENVIIPGGCYATAVFEYFAGTQQNGGTIDPIRTNGNNALGQPEGTDNFVFASLGYANEEGTTGYITLGFDGIIINGEGDDVTVIETSFNNPGCASYPEYADVLVSEDGINFYYAGTVCKGDNSIDISDAEAEAGQPLDEVIQIRIVSNNDMTSTPDGFDVDGVIALWNCEVNPPAAIVDMSDNEMADADRDLTSTITSFPNPTKDISTVSFTTGTAGLASVEVYDMSGRMVESIFQQVTETDQEYRVDFSGGQLPNGVYIFRLTTESDVVIEKFMIAK